MLNSQINVITKQDSCAATVIFDGHSYPAVIGRNGAVEAIKKTEGDGKTPLGSFKIKAIYYRKDKLQIPDCQIPVNVINQDDIWIDDAKSDLYNQPAKLDQASEALSHEKLLRDDHLYDIFLDIDYNRGPIVKGKGSAIFMHVARNQDDPAQSPTAGCVAVSLKDLLEIVPRINTSTVITISQS